MSGTAIFVPGVCQGWNAQDYFSFHMSSTSTKIASVVEEKLESLKWDCVIHFQDESLIWPSRWSWQLARSSKETFSWKKVCPLLLVGILHSPDHDGLRFSHSMMESVNLYFLGGFLLLKSTEEAEATRIPYGLGPEMTQHHLVKGNHIWEGEGQWKY